MIDKVENIIKKENLLTRDDKILVAVSGGVDSMVLIYILSQLGYHISAAHVNFKLREKDSDEDQHFVEHWCEKRNIKIFTRSFNTREHLKEVSDSVQMVARRLRYEWMEEVISKHRLTRLAIGHHVNDSFETTIYNLVKGTGIKGIRGIKIKTDKIVRPLIGFNKEEIISFAREKNIPWREDRSNIRSDYYRNFIRNEIVPKLKTINPSLETTFYYTQQRLMNAEEIVSNVITSVRLKYLSKSNGLSTLDLVWVENQPGALYILSELLSDFGFNYRQSLDVFEARDNTGKQFYSDKYRISVDRMRLDIEEKVSPEQFSATLKPNANVTTPAGNFDCQIVEYSSDFTIPDIKNLACLDADQLKFPLIIRNWQKGDRFKPLGMQGFKKVSDFLIDEKISVSAKEKVLVVISGEDICWLVGFRPDERFKIGPETQNVCLLKTESGDFPV